MRSTLVFATVSIVIAAAGVARATAVELRALGAVGPALTQESIDFAPGVQSGFVEALEGDPTLDPFGFGHAGFDLRGRRLFADARVLRRSDALHDQYRALGSGDVSETVAVLTPGALIVELELVGSYEIATDLAGGDPYASLWASLSVDGDAPASRREFRASSAPDARAVEFEDVLSIEFPVAAGDVVGIGASIFATTGSTADITAFLDARADLQGRLKVAFVDGASPDPGGSAAVPAPPSVWLLALGLVGFVARRRQLGRA